MSTEDYPLLHFADGVIVAPRPPKNGQSLPTPAGTRVTLTQEDGNGNPSLQIFFPAIWHSRPSALDPLASRLRHLSLTGEPRPVRAGSGLCTICDRVGEYILSSRLAKAWGPFADKVRSLENNTIDLPHVLIMGDLADIMRTPDCSLCHLVSTALEECFGGRANVPISYDTPKGNFQNQAAVHFYHMTDGMGDIGFDLALSSADTLIMPMHYSPRLQDVGQVYTPQIRLMEDFVRLLPRPIQRSTEIARRIAPHQADLGAAREVYEACISRHAAVCEAKHSWPGEPKQPGSRTPTPHGIPGLRLIDVEQMCVVHAPQACAFFALSYVKGTAPFLNLNMDTYSRLSKPDALEAHDVPRTFADAIMIAQFFSCKFLWIESLCIVQDGDDKREQMRRISDVFEASTLTIISADGIDPHHGLTGSGPSSPRASRQTVRDIGGLQFAVMAPKLTTAMARLPWAQDGWRYQEAMFSKRVLVFTPLQMYYACKLTSFSEDLCFVKLRERARRPRNMREMHPLYCASDRHFLLEQREFRLPQHWFSYAPLVHDYSCRRFVNEADVLQAVASVLRAMTSPRMEKYIAALPTTIFEYALLWQSLEPATRRPCPKSGYPFPTWSWLGWTGASRLLHFYVAPSNIYPVVSSWMFLTPSPSRRREEPEVEDDWEGPNAEDEAKDQVREFTEDEVHRTLLPFRPEATPIDQEMPFQPTRWTTWDRIPQALQETNPFFSDDSDYFLELIPDHKEEVSRAHPLIESGVLSFTTTGRRFTVESAPMEWTYKEFPQEKTACYRVRDSDTWIGTLQLPRETAKVLLTSDRTEVELILLSETDSIFDVPSPHGPDADLKNFGQYLFDTDKFENVDVSSREHKRLLSNVMWIRRSEGLAFRVCTGQVHSHAWRQSNPQSVRVLLA